MKEIPRLGQSVDANILAVVVEFCREVRGAVDQWERTDRIPPARLLELRTLATEIEAAILPALRKSDECRG